MPEANAETGDVYHVYRSVSTDPSKFGEKKHRPCACTDPGVPRESTWTAIPRLTHGIRRDDVPSKKDLTIGLDADGAWSGRFVHYIKKDKTGGPACEYMGTLPPAVVQCLAARFPRRFGN